MDRYIAFLPQLDPIEWDDMPRVLLKYRAEQETEQELVTRKIAVKPGYSVSSDELDEAVYG